MAIIIEEDNKKKGIWGLVGWVVFVGIALAAVYYIFFTAPELVVIPATGTISTIAPIVSAGIDPQTIVSSTQFESLQSNIALPTPQGPVTVDRSNPFIAP